MTNVEEGFKKPDMLSDWRSSLIAWGLPIAALILGGIMELQAVAYPVALAWIGLGCLINARRCGRRHCFITGPYFLVLALVALGYGSGVLGLGSQGWSWIGGAAIVGGTVLTFVPEMIWGKYVS